MENKPSDKLKESNSKSNGGSSIPSQNLTAQKKSTLRPYISRVVVMHNNIRDIFVHEDHAHHSNLSSYQDGVVKVVNSSDHFFDNDNFWNGSLTWFDHASTPSENKR